MTSHWWFLCAAIVAEVIATSSLKASQGFTQLGASAIVVAGYVVSFYCLSQSLQSIPIGVAYAIWSGAGLVLIGIAAWWFYGQVPDLPGFIGMALIGAGVVVLKLFSGSTPQ